MLEDSGPNRLFRFGIYELESQTGELRKDGKNCPRLQGQPLQMLLLLLDRPGELVTREELRKLLWPADTFVDYDHSLNTAVGKLREVLNDTAANPRFIQTIPRRGYRFVAPVLLIEPSRVPGSPGVMITASSELEAVGSQEEQVVPSASPTGKRIRVLSDPQELPPAPQATTKILFSLLQVMYLGFYVAYLTDLRQTETLFGEVLRDPTWAFALLLFTAAAGIPIRLYFLSAALFNYGRLSDRFQRIFPVVFFMDELWALAPFLLEHWIGRGLALAATAALLFLPFSQRSLLLMGTGKPMR